MSETVPTYDEIIASRRPETFPCWTLEGVESALCCYAAAFYGRQDVAHVIAAGASRVTCVDIDEHKLLTMRVIYAELMDRVTFIQRSAKASLSDLYTHWHPDLVTLDPWTQDIPRVWLEEVPLALAIAPRVVVGYCPHAFEHDGEIAADVRSIAPPGAKVEEILKRSDHRGGVYWVVLGR